jgi:hypothetical protein
MNEKKAPIRIREDALRVASDKLESGCVSCADSYLDVARANGIQNPLYGFTPVASSGGNPVVSR